MIGGASVRVAVAVASALAACAGADGARRGERAAVAAAAEGGPDGVKAADERCPMAIPFTTALLAPTPEGESITYSSAGGEADELRRRVRELAERHNERHGAAAGERGAGSGGVRGGEPDARPLWTPPSRASVEEVPAGARLVLVANDPADVERLQGAVQSNADYLRRSACSMARAE